MTLRAEKLKHGSGVEIAVEFTAMLWSKSINFINVFYKYNLEHH